MPRPVTWPVNAPIGAFTKHKQGHVTWRHFCLRKAKSLCLTHGVHRNVRFSQIIQSNKLTKVFTNHTHGYSKLLVTKICSCQSLILTGWSIIHAVNVNKHTGIRTKSTHCSSSKSHKRLVTRIYSSNFNWTSFMTVLYSREVERIITAPPYDLCLCFLYLFI